jgi:hypothetical protein
MLISEVEPPKPNTPEQQRVANLQSTARRANQALKAERKRQKIARAQKTLTKLRQQPAVKQ